MAHKLAGTTKLGPWLGYRDELLGPLRNTLMTGADRFRLAFCTAGGMPWSQLLPCGRGMGGMTHREKETR